ncbi:Sulfotransferase [Trinorchestia longiramus]|nr:Sulfotransferase [Trinorchestia longiramus]
MFALCQMGIIELSELASATVRRRKMRLRSKLTCLGILAVVSIFVLFALFQHISPASSRSMNSILSNSLFSTSETNLMQADNKRPLNLEIFTRQVEEPPKLRSSSIPSLKESVSGKSGVNLTVNPDSKVKISLAERNHSVNDKSPTTSRSSSALKHFPASEANSASASAIQRHESESLNDENIRLALEYSKKTLELLKNIEAQATPADFVEVPKVGVVQKKFPPAVHISQEAVEDKFTREELKKRAAQFLPQSPVGRFLTEQQRRKTHVAKQCAIMSQNVPSSMRVYDNSVHLVNAYPRFIFDRKHHLAFCPVYKAASTSWSTNLLQLHGFLRDPKGGYTPKIQSLLQQVFPRISGVAGSALTRDAIKFLVVRHPFERLVSCYRDKFQDGTKDHYFFMWGEKMVKLYRPRPPGFTDEEIAAMQQQVHTAVAKQRLKRIKGNPYANPVGPTFPEFVQFIINTREDDEHWRPFHSHCAACNINYDAILKFEYLYDDSVQFIELLNRTGTIQPRWDNLSQDGASTSAVACAFFGQLTADLVQQLIRKYAKDFILYEYDPGEYVKCAKDYKKGMNFTIQIDELEPSVQKENPLVPVR